MPVYPGAQISRLHSLTQESSESRSEIKLRLHRRSHAQRNHVFDNIWGLNIRLPADAQNASESSDGSRLLQLLVQRLLVFAEHGLHHLLILCHPLPQNLQQLSGEIGAPLQQRIQLA